MSITSGYPRQSRERKARCTAFGASQLGLPFLWKAIRLDEITGLLQMRNRYYSVEMGRFLTSDPIGVWQDRANAGNEYCYVGDRVLSVGDQFGLQADTVPGDPDLKEFGKWAGEVAASAISKAWKSWS